MEQNGVREKNLKESGELGSKTELGSKNLKDSDELGNNMKILSRI